MNVTTDFGLPPGYVHRDSPVYYDDGGRHLDEHAMVSQPDVYPRAKEIADDLIAPILVDVGCGHAGKLAAIQACRPRWGYVGIDYGRNLAWCHDRYEWGEWITHDLEYGLPPFARFWPWDRVVVVVADVVEHLVDPRFVLQDLAEVRPSALLISTPDRDLTHGPGHPGPPPNDCHVREWSRDEFDRFLASLGITAVLTETRSDDVENLPHTILAEVRA